MPGDHHFYALDIGRLTATEELRIDAMRARAGAIQFLLLEDWNELSKVGTRLVDGARNHLGVLEKKRIQAVGAYAEARIIGRESALVHRSIVKDLEDPAFRKEIRDLLKADGLTASEVTKTIKDFREAAETVRDRPTDFLDEMVSELGDREVWLARMALLGIQCRWFSRFTNPADIYAA